MSDRAPGSGSEIDVPDESRVARSDDGQNAFERPGPEPLTNDAPTRVTRENAVPVGATRATNRPSGAGFSGALRHHPFRSVFIGLGIAAVGLLGWGISWYLGAVAGSAGGATSVVEVSQGESVGQVTSSLAKEGVIDSSLAFRIYLTFTGTPTVRQGGYVFRRHEAFGAVKSKLATGPDVFDVTIPPGFTVVETAARLGDIPGRDESTFLGLATSGVVHSPLQPAGSTNLDGLLGAGTYRVLPGETDKALLDQMVARFDNETKQLNVSQQAEALGISPYQAVIVASIVQKEGVYSQNLAKVARVVYNRLARGMDLQMDATVLYSEHRDGGAVTSADLALNTPYNTYLHGGLTPTPICFPSADSIRAALNPAAGDWLYFVVVSKDGTEAFSDTLAGQKANEQLAKSRGLP